MLATTVRNTRINLTKLLKLVSQGDEIVIKNRSVPVAMLVPYVQRAKGRFPDLTAFRRSLKPHLFTTGDAIAEVRADRDGR